MIRSIRTRISLFLVALQELEETWLLFMLQVFFFFIHDKLKSRIYVFKEATFKLTWWNKPHYLLKTWINVWKVFHQEVTAYDLHQNNFSKFWKHKVKSFIHEITEVIYNYLIMFKILYTVFFNKKRLNKNW